MFILNQAPNRVEYVTSDIIKSKHAFSTRIGGVSNISYTSSLNLAFNRGDTEETVLENLRLFGEAVGFDPHDVISLPQIHSDIVITATLSMRGEGYFKAPHMSCDGYITEEKGVVLGVKSADCVPIIMEAEDKNGHVAAVSAIHAGWRGTVSGIAGRAVERFVKQGFSAESIRVAIGPSIGACCFEVGDDFLEILKSACGEDFANRFTFKKGQKSYADIRHMNLEILKKSGISEHNVDISNECTFCSCEKYYSHRRSSGQRGTMLSVVFM